MPELELRKRLHAMDSRYRLHREVLLGTRRKHDIVFVMDRVVVDVHGCFWHGCRTRYIAPKTNVEFWSDKIETNRRRNSDTHESLESAGWTHIVVWEHEDPDDAAYRMADLLRSAADRVIPT
jgi:DNA mismatch endonuclease (patch repair protein)